MYVCNHYFLCMGMCNVHNSKIKVMATAPRERGRVLILESIIACSVECYSLVRFTRPVLLSICSYTVVQWCSSGCFSLAILPGWLSGYAVDHCNQKTATYSQHCSFVLHTGKFFQEWNLSCQCLLKNEWWAFGSFCMHMSPIFPTDIIRFLPADIILQFCC
jgi:hypothetical protein